MYCSKCGEKLDEDSKFCTKCGKPVATAETKANNVVESFEKDTQLQDHWIKRVIAYIIDSVIINIATGILLAVALFPAFIANPFGYINVTSFPFASGIAAVIYFVVAETLYGTSIGKTFMMLKVVTVSGEK
ncbi:MAG: RDD family protein, partial [Candidatus Bathyarchaeota archaeon]|nr:RDD family protein [Candidatus Bathyarchaeota archaeon]